MGSIDFDSERADVYISQVRQIEARGGRVRSRPAIDADEKLMAKEVRRRVDRITKGYQGAAQPLPDVFYERFCPNCGRKFSAREWKQNRKLYKSIYPRLGARVDVFTHIICPNRGGK